MSKGTKITAVILGELLVISILHIWLNIGFDKLGLGSSSAKMTFRVGFLPVT
jgi:hypothetical protein